MESEWSVLVTSHQDPGTPAISEQQRATVLGRLPGGDKWIQYPPASGRGHAFETRFWWSSPTSVDAALAAAEALDAYGTAIGAAGLDAIRIEFVHVTSPAERLTEGPIGLDRRRADGSRQWQSMQRWTSRPGVADRTFPQPLLEQLLADLGDDSCGHARDGMVEARFWVDADDAADATEVGGTRFGRSMARLGRGDWIAVRAQATSVTEAVRLAYLGVERRALALDPADLPITLHPAP